MLKLFIDDLLGDPMALLSDHGKNNSQSETVHVSGLDVKM